MQPKILTSLTLLLITAITWFSFARLGTPLTEKFFYSAATLFLIHLVLSIAIAEVGIRYLSDTKTRYAFRKTISVLLLILSVFVLLRIWIPNPEALVVAYGVIAAGIAVALQDLIKNLTGSIVIFFGGLYKVGNRVEIQDTYGDVIDIGLLNTTMLEVREWINGDQATGRITNVPNGAVLTQPIQNYTKHHKYLWDEIGITVTSESNWEKAMQILAEIGHEHTKEFIDKADRSLTHLERYYYVEGHMLEPNTYIEPDIDGYNIKLRYVVNAWERRSTASGLWADIIRAFEKDPAVEIAPRSRAIMEYPMADREKE